MNQMRTFLLAVAAGVLVAAMPAIAQTTIDELLPGGIYDPKAPSWKGQSGMTFLQIAGSARGAGMGDAFAGGRGDASVVFANAAGAASLTGTSAYIGYNNWLVDMTVNNLAVVTDVGFFSVGLAYHSINYGPIEATAIQDGDPNYTLLGTLDPSAWSAGLVVAARLTDRFDAGVTFKYVVQDFGANSVYSTVGTTPRYIARAHSNRLSAIAYDVGTQYDTGLRGIRLNMSLQNFGDSKKFVQKEFELPLTYRVGLSADAIEAITGEPNETHSVMTYVEGVDRRDVRLDFAAGIEYAVDLSSTMDGLGAALRFGRRAARNQDGWLSAGCGITIPVGDYGVQFDYAYNDYGPHFSSQQFGFAFKL